MKFKLLLVIFNIVFFLSFLTIFFLPLFVMDGSYLGAFWKQNWFFFPLFFSVSAAVNALFLRNRKTLYSLEREDWPALAQHLENEVFKRNRIGFGTASLLCDSLVLLGDFNTVAKLRTLVEQQKPRIYNALRVRFVTAALLAKDREGAESLCRDSEKLPRHDREWLSLYAGLSRRLAGDYPGAAELLEPLCVSGKEVLPVFLASYVCGSLLSAKISNESARLQTSAASGRERVLQRFSRAQWKPYFESEKTAMHVVVLGKFFSEAEAWAWESK
ncbi:MAG: hypothetical protein JXP39_08665 [Spirochaetales bacterium]|nr:hypothetical protein [Spirochaetales bacterium]